MDGAMRKKNGREVDRRLLGPVLMGFFIMGFCDIVAPISGRIADEFPAEAQGAVSFLPTMVFLWFLLLSTPMAGLMNRIGRKAMALAGYAFTVAGLVVPYAAGEGCALGWYFFGFGLLGVGNTAIQVAINPLLATIVPGERMTSYLTVGQIFRNTSLLLMAPIVTALVAATGSWRLLLPVYAALTVAGGIWLRFTGVEEPQTRGGAVGMIDCFRLLAHPTVALCAFGVAAFIAADVGIGFLSSRLLDNPDSILTSTGFYACRIVGTIVGAWLLVRYSDVKYLRWNMCGALALATALLFVRSDAAVYLLVGLLGFALRLRHGLCRGDQERPDEIQRGGRADDHDDRRRRRFGPCGRSAHPHCRRRALRTALRDGLHRLSRVGFVPNRNRNNDRKNR